MRCTGIRRRISNSRKILILCDDDPGQPRVRRFVGSRAQPSAMLLTAPFVLSLTVGFRPKHVAYRRPVVVVCSTRADADTSLERHDMPLPPPRSAESSGYMAPEELRTWEPFTYAPPAVRRQAVCQRRKRLASLPPLPALHVMRERAHIQTQQSQGLGITPMLGP